MNARVMTQTSTASDLLSLAKPRLSSLVLITAAGGMWLAPGQMSWPKAFATVLAIAGTVAAANALNCFLERDTDRLMERTARRPLPAGRMEPATALWFGVSLALVSIPALAVAANLLTAGLGLIALLSYVFVYTPLKARTAWAMWVGAVPGALPPLMGWTANTNALDAPGLALFSILFLWQLPHFLAIALFRRDEYQAAGLKSFPLEWGDANSRRQIVILSLALVPVSLLPYTYGLAGKFYLGTAVALGATFFALGAVGWWRQLGQLWARQVFRGSLVYLTVLFAALCLDVVAR